MKINITLEVYADEREHLEAVMKVCESYISEIEDLGVVIDGSNVLLQSYLWDRGTEPEWMLYGSL